MSEEEETVFEELKKTWKQHRTDLSDGKEDLPIVEDILKQAYVDFYHAKIIEGNEVVLKYLLMDEDELCEVIDYRTKSEEKLKLFDTCKDKNYKYSTVLLECKPSGSQQTVKEIIRKTGTEEMLAMLDDFECERPVKTNYERTKELRKQIKNGKRLKRERDEAIKSDLPTQKTT